MRIISWQEKFHIMDRTAVAIGKFDGVHRGHHKLLEEILKAHDDGLKSAVFTFEPAEDLSFKMADEKVLTTRNEKREILSQMGIDILIEFPLNDRTAAISPEDFIAEYIRDSLNAALVVAGPDLSYGYKGSGDFQLLKSMQNICRFETRMIDKVFYEREAISSTRIRNSMNDSNMNLVNSMLGRPYFIGGKVKHGKQLGRTMGFPTVNLDVPSEKMLPQNGVYYSNARIDGKKYPSITNIGTRPTVDENNIINVETFIFGFSGQIYDENIFIDLLEYKRAERKFETLDLLKAELEKDFTDGMKFHGIAE